MTAIISSLEDTASVFYRGRAFVSALADISRMENKPWVQRLLAAITESGHTQRSASLSAGRGPGYVNSLIKSGKVPSVENLMGICEVVDASPAFILWGVDVTPEDAEIISAMRKDPETRDAILALLRRRQGETG